MPLQQKTSTGRARTTAQWGKTGRPGAACRAKSKPSGPPHPHTPTADTARRPRETGGRDAECRTFWSPKQAINFPLRTAAFPSAISNPVADPGGHRAPQAQGSAARRWPPRPQVASWSCAPPTAGPQEAQNGPASAPDAFAAGKPSPMLLPLHPSSVCARERKPTWGREPGLCFGSISIYARAEGQLPSRCHSSSSLHTTAFSVLQSRSPATLGSNKKQDC